MAPRRWSSFTPQNPPMLFIQWRKSPFQPQIAPLKITFSSARCGLWFNKESFDTMADLGFRFRRSWKATHRRSRELMMILKGLGSTDHPVLAHIIPIRRCNLACAYCNEYDDYSNPVPLDVMRRRLDRLAELGTTIITRSGG